MCIYTEWQCRWIFFFVGATPTVWKYLIHYLIMKLHVHSKLFLDFTVAGVSHNQSVKIDCDQIILKPLHRSTIFKTVCRIWRHFVTVTRLNFPNLCSVVDCWSSGITIGQWNVPDIFMISLWLACHTFLKPCEKYYYFIHLVTVTTSWLWSKSLCSFCGHWPVCHTITQWWK